MDAEQLRAFVLVAQTRSVSKAAKRLAISQPALSRKLQHLEMKAGATLMARGPRGVALTEAGERFLGHAERALAELDAAVAELDQLSAAPHGLVAIGSISTVAVYALPSVLAHFARQHPAVRIKAIERLPEALEEKLASGELDLALLHLPVRRPGLTVRKLWQEDYLLAVPKPHRLASMKRPLALSEITSEPLIVVAGAPSTKALEAACVEQGVVPKIVLEADNLESVRRMVERGLGIAMVPRIMAAEHGRSSFSILEIVRGPRRQVALAHRGSSSLSLAAQALRLLVIDKLGRGTSEP